MSTCRWCTPSGSDTTEFLKSYAVKELSLEDLKGSNEDLCYCLECVVEYHKAREELPKLHEILWELETSRLVAHIEKSIQEDSGEDDELFIVNENGETQLSDDVGPDFENNLRVPLLEILKYPYLLLHKKVSELCVEVLCRMEQNHSSFQVFEKYPGIYLFLVHPNEVIRRWAILTARNLGKVDRDDYYDLQEVLTCLFKVIELGLFDSPDIYNSSMFEKGKLILLPSHLYDTTNYKNYWLGICMLLTVLEEQAMDSLLLGPEKQNDFMQSILHTMEKEAADDSTDPFWPALHCFMVILDQLGSKVWGQLIDPVQAFQTIINSVSYNNEIKNIRSSCKRTKSEPESDYNDDMITCSQIVYNYNTEKLQKDTGWKTAICPDYCPNMYEDMQTLANVLQSDIGRDMRVHNSTFLWFIPFVQSLMDLKDLGVAYIVEVIHYLYSEIKDILNERIQQCDKISEFFLLILVSIIELHRNKKCLHLLWISSQEWVEVVVRCAKLPAIAFTRCTEKSPGHSLRGSSGGSSQASNSVQHACVQLIRSLLKEGCQLGQQALCKQYLNKLNLLLRGNLSLGWQLNIQETQELQLCLKQVIRYIKDRALSTSVAMGNSASSAALPNISKQEKGGCGDVHGRNDLCSSLAVTLKEDRDKDCPENPFSRSKCAWEEGCRDASKGSTSWMSTEGLLMNIKKEHNEFTTQEYVCLQNSLATEVCGKAQEHRNSGLVSGKCSTDNQCLNPSAKLSDLRGGRELENKCEAGPISNMSSSSSSKFKVDARGLMNLKKLVQKTGLASKISQSTNPSDLKSCSTSCKNEPGVQKDEDAVLISEVTDTILKTESTEEKSSPLLKSVFKKDPDMEISDQEQPNLSTFFKKHYSKGQISKTLCVEKTSENDLCPSTSERKRGVSNPTSQIRPLSVKSESSDSLLKFSEYFKRENNVGKKEENFVKTVAEDNPLTDSQVDRDLSKLSLAAYAKGVNFPFDSSQEGSVQHSIGDIKRKVKGAVRSSSAGQSTKSSCDGHDNQIIVISDSSDEDNVVVYKEEAEKMNENVCPEKQPLPSSGFSESKAPNSPFSLEDCDSQCFEFETEGDVFSVWQDTQDYTTEATQEYKQGYVSPMVDGNNSDGLLDDHTNEWGYDDYVSDGVMEEAVNLVEKQTDNTSSLKEADNAQGAAESMLQESVSKGNAKDQLENCGDEGPVNEDFPLDSKSTEPRASTSSMSLASKLALKKNIMSPRKNAAKSKVARTTQRSPKRPPVLKTAQNKKHLLLQNSQPGRSVPAVVPPRKVRECPAPESTAEKLGLKKGPRKAFELSQRSLESVAQLRSHGRAAGRVAVAQKRKSKLIAPQNLSVKYNKKLLACQDRLHYRQTRPQKGVKNPAGSSESRGRKVSKGDANSGISAENQRQKKREETVFPFATERKFESPPVEEEKRFSKMPVSSDSNRKSEDNGVMVSHLPVNSSLSAAALVQDDKDEASRKGCNVQPECKKTTSKENGYKPNENSDEDDDNLFLTQSDPVDMDICSEEESVVDTAITSKKTEEMGAAESLQQRESSAVMICKHKDCMEKVEKTREYCSKHSDNLFAKPSLLPPSKTRKPSTTKIFSSASSSRNAAFSKDLEDVKKPPPASRNKENTAKPASAKAVPTGNQTSKPPSSLSVPQLWSCNNVLQSLNRQSNNTTNIARRAAQQPPPFLDSKQRDHTIFVNEVLKWTYQMFAKSNELGPPSDLLQSLVGSVPVQFQGEKHYFDTLFPLMMLNAFETLAKEWIENQRVREKSYYFNLENFSSDLNTANFTANFTAHFKESDLAKQLHPKEDDLIFLVVQKKKDAFREESEMEPQPERHVGLVKRFTRASGCAARQNEQHTVCHLSVQTRGNLSFCMNKQVKCVVVGSLVTTRRTFKALLLLHKSCLIRPILNPSYDYFCPRSLPAASESAALAMNGYNEGQKRAIDTAYAMVKEHPELPKICLIHGPPGTGKSKTIVGLLSRVLGENTRNEKATQKPNFKTKTNRFLVCAPSNAAVDELMKKIIVSFKEKCQNRQEPLGNCGDIKLVRLGAEKTINSEVRGFGLDKQVEHRMKRKPTDCDQDMQKKKAALDQQLDLLSRQRAMHRCQKREVSQMLDDEIARISKERQQLASQLKEVRGRAQKVQDDIILESDIICCTLSTSGGGLLESAFGRQGRQRFGPFCCVIVDEAGQSCEVETLIPLIHRCSKLVLVGDHKQLPPTVKSLKAQEYGYDQSLMARLHRHLEEQVRKSLLRSLPVVQLTVQYRMHPDICLFPSNYVYGRALKTDKATEENRCSSDWPFQPYLIFDVGDGQEERDHDSFSNPQEVKLVMELIRTIKEKRKDLGLRRIGIITPYSAQKKKIQEQMDKLFKNNSPGEVDTVDAFQGREKDCIIVTCVRANSTRGSIGFLASLQRLNVTITRARFSLFILGKLKTLMENKDWNALIQDAQKRGAIIRTSEKSYRNDAVKILKLKPTVQPPTKAGIKPPPVLQGSSSSKRVELANPSLASSPQDVAAGPGQAVPQGGRGTPQAQGAQAVDSRRGSAPTPGGVTALPTQEKPRDPRLASRTGPKGKEQVSKDGEQSAQSNPGSASQRGLAGASAARDQISGTETSKKPQQAMGQCEVPSTSPQAAWPEGDCRAPVLKSSPKPLSDGGQSTSSVWNKDSRVLPKRTSDESPENTESNGFKRRKT
ncbi:probable helicase senataxin isoform X2 [Heliangelus exortis]|uniref:probable helicase senataxin isoform X2 n=1 Tax=Heliangelus exortis TaxID=472823 RepID=UPI003A8CBD7B